MDIPTQAKIGLEWTTRPACSLRRAVLLINHHQPDDSMCERLFEALKIPRQEVFTDASWNLTPETFQAGR